MNRNSLPRQNSKQIWRRRSAAVATAAIFGTGLVGPSAQAVTLSESRLPFEDYAITETADIIDPGSNPNSDSATGTEDLPGQIQAPSHSAPSQSNAADKEEPENVDQETVSDDAVNSADVADGAETGAEKTKPAANDNAAEPATRQLADNESLISETTFGLVDPRLPNNTVLGGQPGVTTSGDITLRFTGGQSGERSDPNDTFLVTGGDNRRVTGILPDQGTNVTYRVEIEFSSHSGTRSAALEIDGETVQTLQSTGTTNWQTLETSDLPGGSEFAFVAPQSMRLRSIRVFTITDQSDTGPTTPEVQPIEDAVENLNAAVGASGTVGLSWLPVPGADKYVIRVGSSTNEPIGETGTTHFQATGLVDGTEYTFYVTAANQVGEGPAAQVTATPVQVNMYLEAEPWQESVTASWQGAPGETYRAYIRPTGEEDWTLVNPPAHDPLVRLIDDTNLIWRADVPGLRGNQSYDLRVVANGTGVESVVNNLVPVSFDRTGYAFSPQSRFGWTSGGYNPDGTIREDAVVIYVTEANMNTFTNPFNNGRGLAGLFPANGAAANRGSGATAQELQANTRPLIVRFVGQVGSGTIIDGMTVGRPQPGPVLQGGGNIPVGLRPNDRMLNVQNTFNVTLEGIGPDAVIYGWGIRLDTTQNAEIRNLHIELPWDDGIMLAGGNQNQEYQFDTNGGAHNIWVHNIEIGPGQNRSNEDEDMLHGDGALDMGDEATFVTISYNLFNHSDKSMLANGNNGRPFFRTSNHHNWFRYTNQRHPRVRTGMAHVFNNFFEGTGVQGIQAGDFANIVAEGNYFLNATNPLVISGQGSGLNPSGTNRMGSDNAGALVTSDVAGWEDVPAWVGALVPNEFVDVIGYDPLLDIGFYTGPGNVPGALAVNPNGTQRLPHTFGHVGPAQAPLDMVPADFYSYTATSAEAAREAVIKYAGPQGGFLPNITPPAVTGVQPVINPDGTFTLTWAQNILGDSFEIELDGEWLETVGRVSSFTTTQTKATQGGTYTFRVRALNSTGVGDWSVPQSVTYAAPSAPRDLKVTTQPTLGGMYLNWTAPVGEVSGYAVTIAQVSDSDGNPVTDPMVVTADVARPSFSVTELDPGTYTVKVRSRVGSLLSTPLDGSVVIDEFLIRTSDLLAPVLGENFEAWPVGPVRDDALIRRLGLFIRANSGNVAGVTGNPMDTFPASIWTTPEWNDAAIVTDIDGDDTHALMLIDRSNGNILEAHRFGTHMELNLPEEISAGRVLVQFDLNLAMTQGASGQTPLILRDRGGRVVFTRNTAALDLPFDQWFNIVVVLDFDSRTLDWYVDGELREFGVPMPENVTGLAQIAANTPRGNQSANANVDLSLIYDNFSVRVPGEAPPEPELPGGPEVPGGPEANGTEFTGILPDGSTIYVRVAPNGMRTVQIDGTVLAIPDDGWVPSVGVITFDSAGVPTVQASLRDGGNGVFFHDVAAGDSFYQDIWWLASEGISTGWAAGDGTSRFGPGQPVTREAMAAFLYRAAGSPQFTPPAVPTFSDVPLTSPFYAAIEWLNTTGVTQGFDDGTFRPGAPVTRAAMAAFLYRLANISDGTFTPRSVSPFSDVQPGDQFYDQIMWLAQNGITDGFSDGTFRPGAPVTRQAMAAFLRRADRVGGGAWDEVWVDVPMSPVMPGSPLAAVASSR